ncbi:hypothetical protein ASE07_26615 [Noviherbaspirillum sp. Root189]|nr:hypothetical protein ASE07_26615 [Noviherbaspirillum sp. Root189]
MNQEHSESWSNQCSKSSARILGETNDLMPVHEAPGKFSSIARGGKVMTLEGKMLPNRPKAGEEGLCSCQ